MPGNYSRHPFNTIKILIIEDDSETKDYVSAGLKEADHNIDSARDGYEGMLLAKEGKHGLLIVDRMLPGLYNNRDFLYRKKGDLYSSILGKLFGR